MSLKRVLGSTDATWLVAGNMIGAGIFITPGFVAGHLPGLFWPLLAWVLGGLLALCGAAVYAELGARIPKAGGDYQYLSRAFGPVWGFLTGWSALVLTFSAAAAAMCKVAFDYAWTAWGSGEAAPWLLRLLVPPLLIVGLTLANLVGVRFAGKTTVLLTAVPLVALVVTFGAGLVAGRGSPRWPELLATPQQAWPIALGAAMIPVFFTYSGWNAAAYLAGELNDPGRDLARALLTGAAAVTALYLTINLVLLAVLSGDLAGTPTPGADAARILLGPAAERGLAMIVAVAILGSANVTLMAGSRVYYAMALDGLAPRALTRTTPSGVPAAALWWGGTWSAALAATAGVTELVSWATLAILLLSSMTVAALFVLRRRDPAASPFVCPGYPVTPWIYLLACLGVAVASTVHDPWRALWGLLLVLAGLPVYALAHRSFDAAESIRLRPSGYASRLYEIGYGIRNPFYDLIVWWGMLPLGGVAACRREFARWCRPEPDQRVASLCCGTGSTELALLERVPSLRITGIDLGTGQLATARRKTPREKVDYRVGNARSTMLPSAGFDRVVIVLALHEMPRDLRLDVLREARRLCKPDGLIVAIEHARPRRRASRLFQSLWWLFWLPGNPEAATSRDLQRHGLANEMREAGMQVVERQATRREWVQGVIARP